MFDSFNPVLSLPLTVATSKLIINGTLQTRRRRLSDVLNEADTDHLVLFDTTFVDAGSGRVLAGPATAQIQLDDVLFVHTSDVTESGQEVRTPKRPIEAVLVAPPYVIAGDIHLPFESELSQAVDALTGRFVPVTRARYWTDDEASATHVDLLVVNHARAHVAVPAGVEWQGEALPETVEDAGSNPW
jgi:hypothetical protein